MVHYLWIIQMAVEQSPARLQMALPLSNIRAVKLASYVSKAKQMFDLVPMGLCFWASAFGAKRTTAKPFAKPPLQR
jgi:hypothetical protein